MTAMLSGMVRIVAVLLGIYIVLGTLLSAVKTFVVPRSINVWLTRMIFQAVFSFFRLRLRGTQTYEDRDRIMVLFAPLTLLLMPTVWLALLCFGYMFIYWGLMQGTLFDAFKLSGSSLLTLGIVVPTEGVIVAIAFTEAAIGLIMVALLISYLPAIYGAFSQRELMVALLEVRADTPPSSYVMLERFQQNSAQGVQSLGELFEEWETWFAQIDETHTSLAALVFFRSPRPGRSWITAAGAILDAASLYDSTINAPRDIRARLCIRAGFVALRHICDFFRIPYDPNPKPTDTISISQDEYNGMYDALKAAGVNVKPDREQAWRDYAGWRVNYDVPLLALAELTMAPYAEWISDRGLRREPRRRYFGLFNAAKQLGRQP
jgi:hypothetical protein